jgi:hypothetical protein
MESGEDEPEDWPVTHDAMRTLDSLLRCSACKLLLDTPLRPACPHAFCSECLRKWITARETGGKAADCPVCREVRRPAAPATGSEGGCQPSRALRLTRTTPLAGAGH